VIGFPANIAYTVLGFLHGQHVPSATGFSELWVCHTQLISLFLDEVFI
jgi:hypothetical protein